MVRAHHIVRRLAMASGLVALVANLEAQVYPGRGRPIEFSEPRSGVAATNISEMNADKTSLRKLDDEFKKPFELFGAGDSPGARLTAPPPPRFVPPPPSRSLRELLQKRDQWLELEAGETEGLGLTAEEMLGVPRYGADGKPVKRRTEVERYYDDLDRARAAAQAAVTNRAARDALNAKFFGEEEELKPLNLKLFEEPVSPFAQQTDERNKPATQKSEFPGFADLAAPRNGPRDFAEIFGFSSGHKTPGFTVDAEAFQSRKRHVEDLISLRFVNAAGAGANSLPGLGSAPAALMQNPAAAGPNLPASAASTAGSGGSLGSPGAGLGGIFNPAALPGSGLPSLAGPPASAGLQPTWSAPTPPPPTQPKLSPTPFQIPQRKF